MRIRQRRLKLSRLKNYLFKTKIVTFDNEGVPNISYEEEGLTLKGEIWPATSRRQIETYGDRINNISNMRVVGDFNVEVDDQQEVLTFEDFDFTLRLGDGVYVYNDAQSDPDFRIVNFTNYHPLLMEIEKI